MKKKSKYIIRDITLFFFVILVTACLLFLTIGTLNRLIDQQSKEHAYTTLREESLYNTKELKDTFKDEEDMLKMLAENVCDNKDNFETIKRLLENGVNNSVYSMIAVTDKEGNSYCSDGNHKTVAKQDFFVRSLRGETVLSKPVLDEKTGEYYVVLSVPIIDDTKIVGTLRGAYKYEKWEKALANNVFSETGFFRIVDVDGNIIVSTSASDKKNNVKNIFLSDENIRPLSNEGTTENIKQNFKDSKSDACVMRIDNTDRYGFYQPVGFNQWYIISGVSPNFADVMNNITKRKSQKALGFIFFVIILLILFVIWQNRKQNKSLLFNKGYLESIIESIQGGVVVNSLDPDFKVIFASEGATVISGYTSTEVINKPNLDFVYADDREKVNEHIKRLVNGIDDKLSVEYRLVRKDGSRIWVLERGRILKNIKGIPFMHSVFMDIDAQKNLENELKINEKSYKIAIENSGLIMFEYNILNKTFVFFDETGEKNIDDLEKFKTLESILENSHLDEKNKKVLYDCYKKINEGSKMEENTVRWFGNDKKEVIFRTKITTVFDNDEKAISAIGVGRDITSLYMLEKERAFTKIIESENNLSFTANLEKKTITDGSSTWFDMGEIHSGMVFEHVVAEIANTIIHKDDRSRVVTELNSEYLKKLYENNVLSHNVEYRRMLDNNEYIWVETEIKMFNDPFNDELMADFFIHNINDKKLKQLALIEKAEHDGLTGIYNRITAQTMIDNYLKTCDIMSAKSAFLILDIDKFKNFNDTFGHMFGDEILRECANKLKILFRDDDILGRLGGDEFIVMMKNVRETKTVINKVKEMLAFMTRDYRRSEANFSFTISVGVAFVSATADTYDILYKNADMALYNSKMNGRNRYSVFGDDINNIESDGITTSQYLNEFGSVDPITGGDSFASFKKKLTSLFAENPTDKFVIFYSDIKNFKAINGIYGFEKGDEVLREYSNFLAQKKTLLFARANVDNFVSVERYENENDLVKRVTSGFEGFEGISKVLENKANLRISLGAYCTDGKNDEFSIEEMIDRANLAQKQLKDENRTGFVLYKEDFRIAMINDQIIANKMENALKNKEFLPYLQPKFNINSGEIVGAEVLARWHDPIDGLIMPERFIPLFESNGFIKHMDTYMFEKTCEMLRKWIDNGKKVIPLSVNVSKIQINNSKFLDTYLSIKNKYNIPNGLIEIELTESILFDNIEMMLEMLKFFKENGICVSIDDFGSGYSSLNLLKEITADTLKMDAMFFKRNNYEDREKIIIKNVINMAKELEMKTVAEGVSRQEQVDFLKKVGCNIVQGYIFDVPQKLEAFEEKYINI